VPDRYRVREIAQQVGLSEATVDRAPLQRLAGRKYLVDVFMQAPQRFSNAFDRRWRPRCRRWHLRWSAAASSETGSVPKMVETLDKIGARGSHGVIDGSHQLLVDLHSGRCGSCAASGPFGSRSARLR
jgi:LacI family transcriptional regulator